LQKVSRRDLRAVTSWVIEEKRKGETEKEKGKRGGEERRGEVLHATFTCYLGSTLTFIRLLKAVITSTTLPAIPL
jgi:hypothetical protein